MKRGKKYKNIIKKIDNNKKYVLQEAISTIKEVSYSKFDGTIDISFNLNLKRGTTVRDTLVLPNQFRGEKKILVFTKGDNVEKALNYGASYAGADEYVQKIKDGWLDFEVVIATPDMMKDLGKIGATLGRRGLMPNPKTGTVTNNLEQAINEYKKGRVEFRTDKTGVINISVGKVSMDDIKIKENITTLFKEIQRKRPQETKGEFIRGLALSATMSPGIKLDFSSL